MFSQFFQYQFRYPFQFFFRVGKDEYIVHIDNDQSVVNHSHKDVVHHSLKGCQGITHSKEHHSWFKSPLFILKAAFHSSPFLICTLL
jgi:hypothetical protein